jgi:hypothetical protein
MATNWNLTIRLRDSFNAAASMAFYGQIATLEPDPVAAAQAASNALLPDVDAVTDSQIVEALMTVSLSLPGSLKGAPVAGSLNTSVGNIDYTSNSPGDGWTMVVPNIVPALVAPGGKLIPNAGALATLTTLLTTQTGGIANYWTDEDRNFLANYFYGGRGTRKFRRSYGVRPQRNRVLG